MWKRHAPHFRTKNHDHRHELIFSTFCYHLYLRKPKTTSDSVTRSKNTDRMNIFQKFQIGKLNSVPSSATKSVMPMFRLRASVSFRQWWLVIREAGDKCRKRRVPKLIKGVTLNYANSEEDALIAMKHGRDKKKAEMKEAYHFLSRSQYIETWLVTFTNHSWIGGEKCQN